ncbi:hypothetical protein NKH99_31545 [Mesorhizobium sp. M0854]|uniref:hypothetical protein n=1 Tax=Mesorhizobium sp. M0854 TaxID=2957013 RepID=UPI00333C1205
MAAPDGPLARIGEPPTIGNTRAVAGYPVFGDSVLLPVRLHIDAIWPAGQLKHRLWALECLNSLRRTTAKDPVSAGSARSPPPLRLRGLRTENSEALIGELPGRLESSSRSSA